MFVLDYIKIFDGCIGQKNVAPGKYTFVGVDFNQFPPNFYGKGICVSAIVGKNGSGKSSVLDIMYRVINNLCALICTNLNRKDYTAFVYICGVRAEIGYTIKEQQNKRNCKLRCIDNELYVTIPDSTKPNDEILWHFGNGNPVKDYTHKTYLTDKERTKLAKNLFYCSVVNYAPFTLNSNEYVHETSWNVNEELVPDKIDLRNHNWLQSIFHKNDGYQSNITLVPYRDYGKFDATKESKLARERILEILLSHKGFIDGYCFDHVHFTLNEDSFKHKFSLTKPTAENGYKPQMEIKEFIQQFEAILENYVLFGEETISTRILKELGYGKDEIEMESRPHLLSYLYLVYKVLNSARYPSFSEYSVLADTNLAIENDSKLLDKASSLAKAIETEHSHITFKIERVRKFIEIINRFDWDVVCSHGFDFEEYVRNLNIRDWDDNLIPIARILPPSFFDFEVFLRKDNSNEKISFESLSSGERQFYVSVSAIIYHAMNLISVPENEHRVKYKNMLVVLDEVELCFHPDFQRVFINNLISIINRVRFNKDMNFHILLTSHSPFILSDIPSSNILYLENGNKSADSERFINPFCANINDILSQSFFLDKDGFIGEHAKRVIVSLHDFLSGKENYNKIGIHWNKESAKHVIDSIGEPLIKETLMELYNDRFQDADSIREQIQKLRLKLREME